MYRAIINVRFFKLYYVTLLISFIFIVRKKIAAFCGIKVISHNSILAVIRKHFHVNSNFLGKQSLLSFLASFFFLG